MIVSFKKGGKIQTGLNCGDDSLSKVSLWLVYSKGIEAFKILCRQYDDNYPRRLFTNYVDKPCFINANYLAVGAVGGCSQRHRQRRGLCSQKNSESCQSSL